MNNQDFDDEELQIVDAVARFVSQRVRPNVGNYERDQEFPEELVDQMKQIGLYGLVVPEAYGGLSLRLPVFAIVMETLAAGWTTLAAYVNSHATVAYLIGKYGSEVQKQQYLPRMATGDERGALCLTEPGAGSDLQSITTRATLNGVNWTLNGNKIFITNGASATIYATLARTNLPNEPKGRNSLFLVPRAAPGVSLGGKFDKMAFGLVDTMEVRFQDVTLSGSEALLGKEPGHGMSQLLDGLEIGRIAIAASAVGLGSAALAEALRYSGERKAFGVTIDKHQAVQLHLADIATKLMAARCLTAEAARNKQSGARTDMLSAMAKTFASEACAEAVRDALRVHGGYGYIRDFPIERFYREAPLYLVGEGTNEINRLVIARRLNSADEAAVLRLPS